MRFVFCLVCACVMPLMSGCAAHRAPVAFAVPSPVVVLDTVRDALPNDYLRVTFLPADVKVTSLSRPEALRAFATATPLFSPPLKLEDFPYYLGLENQDDIEEMSGAAPTTTNRRLEF